jgi:hypothetical protein
MNHLYHKPLLLFRLWTVRRSPERRAYEERR